MKNYVLIAVVALLLLASCKKAEEKKCDYKGDFAFNCAPGAPGSYAGYIDNEHIRDFVGGQLAMFHRDTGVHVLRVSGSGINYQDTVRLHDCETITYNLP